MRSGIFGPLGGSLAGLPFSLTWTGIPCDCTERDVGFNPVIDAALTISGVTYDFGAGNSGFGDFFDNLHQTQSRNEITINFFNPPVVTSTYTQIGTNNDLYKGFFVISLYPYQHPDTSGTLLLSSITDVPGPIAGEGLVGLVPMLLFVAYLISRTLKNNCGFSVDFR